MIQVSFVSSVMDLLLHKNYQFIPTEHFFITDFYRKIRKGNRNYFEIEKLLRKFCDYLGINLVEIDLRNIHDILNSQIISSVAINTGLWPIVLESNSFFKVDKNFKIIGSNYGADFLYLKSNILNGVLNWKYLLELKKWQSIKKYQFDCFIFPSFKSMPKLQSNIYFGLFQSTPLHFIDQNIIIGLIVDYLRKYEIGLSQRIENLDLVLAINSDFDEVQLKNRIRKIQQELGKTKLLYTLKFHPNYYGDKILEEKIKYFMKIYGCKSIEICSFQKLKSMPLEFIFSSNRRIRYVGNRSSALSYLNYENINLIDSSPSQVNRLDKRSYKSFEKYLRKYN